MTRTAVAASEEVEITREMIEAGVSEFLSYDPRVERPEDVVPLIFRAMCRASPKAHIREVVSARSDDIC